MKDTIRKYMESNHMTQPGEKLIVGVSGGADSVCLLLVLKELEEELGIQLVGVHIHHGLRGTEADQDEFFARELCEREGVPFYCIHSNVGKLAKEESLSLEEAGRKARYEAFAQIAVREGAQKIALAHHKDDLAETVLHHLARGTGLVGLSGIRPISGMRIRPLLCVGRKEITQYLLKRGQEWQTDSSNLEDHYTRNKIRHHVIPYLKEEINQNTVEHIAAVADELRQMDEFLWKQVEERSHGLVKQDGNQIWIGNALAAEADVIQYRIAYQSLKKIAGGEKDLGRIHVELIIKLMEKPVGRRVNLPQKIWAKRTYDGILVGKGEKGIVEKQEAFPLQIPGKRSLPFGEVICTRISRDEFDGIVEKKYTKWMDYDKISGNVVIRHRKNGDRICVQASGGTKKLKDYFIDRKIPQEERDKLWVIADESEILWVVGERLSERYKVTDRTKEILCIKIKGGDTNE